MRKKTASWLLLLGLASSGHAAEVRLESGDVLVGEIVSESDQSIVLDHPLLGRITIPASEVEKPPPNPAVFGGGFLEGWTRSLSAGMSGASGSSKNFAADAQLALERDNEDTRQVMLAAYFYASDDKLASSNRFLASYDHDLLLSDSRWFLFGQGRYDYDEFKAWDHRLAASLGAGYQLIQSDLFELRGRMGAGLSQTFGGEEELRPEGLAGIEGVWTVSENQNFTLASSFYPDLGNAPEFRTLSKLDWNIALADVKGLGLKIGFLHEYDSETQSAENHDLRYYGNVSYDF